jgi:hypothetical protein
MRLVYSIEDDAWVSLFACRCHDLFTCGFCSYAWCRTCVLEEYNKCVWALGGECNHVEDSKHVDCVHMQDLIFFPRCLSLRCSHHHVCTCNRVGKEPKNPFGRFSKAPPSCHLPLSFNLGVNGFVSLSMVKSDGVCSCAWISAKPAYLIGN